MVKPPKTMQPESVNLPKAGRASGKAFKDDSFHNYMARKIDLQRKQFGVVLPPPPPPPPEKVQQVQVQVQAQTPSTTSFASPKNRKRSRNEMTMIKNVHFASSSSSSSFPIRNDAQDKEDPTTSTQQQQQQQHTPPTSMTSILRNLQKRHGRGNRRVLSRREHSELLRRMRKRTKALENNSDNNTNNNNNNNDNNNDKDNGNDNDDVDDQLFTRMNSIPTTETSSSSPYSTTASPSRKFRQKRPDLFFLGVVVKVNGYTDPDNETIKRLLQCHGGDFETYETSRVTHIVAEAMSTAKANYMKKQKRPRPVVRPTWILDSIKAQKLLPIADYLLKEFKDMHNNGEQIGIKKMLRKTTSRQQQQEEELKYSQKNQITDEPLTHAPKTCSKYDVTQSMGRLNSPTKDDSKESSLSHETNQELSKLHQKNKTDDKFINGRIRTVGTDPNFLDSFFSNSRLSFIGSYKQRMQSFSKQLENPNNTLKASSTRFIFHVDMDCFFANVVLRNYPQYRDKPVAISHLGRKPNQMTGSHVNENSTSECATCNYHARKFGITKGMFLGRAKQLCPQLVVLEYDFAGYEEVSDQVIQILNGIASEHDGFVEAVSCDEAYVELYVSNASHIDPEIYALELAEKTRQEILLSTQCTASIGVAVNKFLSKLGTDKAKPNGAYVVKDYRELLRDLKLRDLPGIGYRSEPKLIAEGLETVQDIWDLGCRGETVLSSILGPGLGKKIYDYSNGKDTRPVQPTERKSIGAQCYYGVRFDGEYGIKHFMKGLANEVERRMTSVGCKGSKLTLKVKKRKPGAKAPPKFLGHGSCFNISKSMNLPGSIPSRNATVLSQIGITLFENLDIHLDDVRGIGMVVNNLTFDDADIAKPKAAGSRSIQKFFQSSLQDQLKDEEASVFEPPSDKAATKNLEKDSVDGRERGQIRLESMHKNNILDLPPMSQICLSQVAALPREMQDEIHSRVRDYRTDKETSVTTTKNNESSADSKKIAVSKDDKTMIELDQHNFRQTNLRRMMKLVAFKSGHGKDGLPDVSIRELERLPLEIQLQIVNGDMSPLGTLSQREPSSNQNYERRTLSRVDHKKCDTVNMVDPIVAISPTEMEASNAEVSSYDISTVNSSNNFFEDDVVPLHHFLDENCPTNCDAIDVLIEFFRTCLEERVHIIRPLLRGIRRRGDEWSEKGVLLNIVHLIDEAHFQTYRRRLDIHWLVEC